MACTECGHDDHGTGPCSTCAASNSQCWQQIRITGGDGDRSATGQIEMAHGLEQHPCLMCRSFEKDRDKLVRHLIRLKLTPDENGIFTTPIAKDIPGRQSLKLDPRNFGWCRKQTLVVDMLATCPDWTLTRTFDELASRIS